MYYSRSIETESIPLDRGIKLLLLMWSDRATSQVSKSLTGAPTRFWRSIQDQDILCLRVTSGNPREEVCTELEALTHAATRIGAERLHVWRRNLLRFTSTVEHLRHYCQFGRLPCSCVSTFCVQDVASCEDSSGCEDGALMSSARDGKVADQQILAYHSRRRLFSLSHVLVLTPAFGRSELTRRRMTGNNSWLTMSLCMPFVFLSSRDSISGVAPSCSPALLPHMCCISLKGNGSQQFGTQGHWHESTHICPTTVQISNSEHDTIETRIPTIIPGCRSAEAAEGQRSGCALLYQHSPLLA